MSSKKEKTRSEDVGNSNRNGSFYSSSQGKENGILGTSSNFGEPNLRSSTPPARPERPGVHLSALELADQRGSKESATAAGQIEADILEVRNIIANYAVEPLEMLHLIDRWLQQLLGEFLDQRDRFKHQLFEKWQNQELTNIKYDNNDRIRRIFNTQKELERARETILSGESFGEFNTYLEKTDDDTPNEIKEKFNSLYEQYSKIVQCLEFIDRETESGDSGHDIRDIKTNLSRLKKLNDKQSHTICIVGLEKAGKSTFINALLGYQLLPTASERCTQVRTVLKPPLEDGDQRLFATVKFYDDQEFRVFFEQMTMKTDEKEDQLQQRKTHVFQRRENLKGKFPQEDFRIGNTNNIDRERTAIIKQLHEYITEEVYVNIIKEIAIYTDNLPGKNYELLDVPGFDSPIKEHCEAGIAAVKSADAFLFLTNGQQPSLTQPQISLLREIQDNHYEAMQRAFGVITKLDLCQTQTIYQEHYRKASAELIDKRFKPERIYATCSRIQLLQENSEEYRVIDRKIRSFGDELVEGFDRTKDDLNQFIEYELPKTHLKQLADLGRMRLARYVPERLNKIIEKALLPQNMNMMSIDKYIEQQNNENWDRIYYKDLFDPVFARANYWHTNTVTKERTKFIEDAKQKFYDTFLDLTKEFIQRTYPIERLTFEKYGYSKRQLGPHRVDDNMREELCMEMEKLVDNASNILAKYFYHEYVCKLENILNEICPQLTDLYRTKLTLEKCTNETHALILRVCRPIITATLRFSHVDVRVKQHALTELIYIAPITAFNISQNSNRDGGNGILGKEILKSVELLGGANDMMPASFKKLFKE